MVFYAYMEVSLYVTIRTRTYTGEKYFFSAL